MSKGRNYNPQDMIAFAYWDVSTYNLFSPNSSNLGNDLVSEIFSWIIKLSNVCRLHRRKYSINFRFILLRIHFAIGNLQYIYTPILRSYKSNYYFSITGQFSMIIFSISHSIWSSGSKLSMVCHQICF
jgi:hypothetical protein